MNLQNVGALWWLVPLGGAIVLLYLLRMRRRDVRVPASFLWPERTEEVRANALIQRLRFNWLLVLQLCALALALFAIAKPQVRQQGLAGEVTVLVVDASASMGAVDVRPSRFEEARRLVSATIQSAKPGDRIALIEAGPMPRVVFPLSSDPSRERRALEGLRRYDSECDMGEALRLASALVGGQDGARIVLLSDGCFEPVRNFSRGKAAVVYERIGQSSRNAALTALGTADTPQGRSAYVGARNYGIENIDAVITVRADGDPISSERVTLRPGVAWGKTLDAPPKAKVFEATLESSQDASAADNYAVSIAAPGATLRTLLVSRGDPFLERALVLDPRVTLDRATALPNDTSRYDVVVFDGVEERPTSARGVLTFGSAGASSPVVDLGPAKAPQFVSQEKDPLLDGVSFDGLYVERCRKVRPRPSGQVIALNSAGPLVVASQSTNVRQIYVSFEPLSSDFPLQVSFPIFVGNALTYLGGHESSDLLAVRPGAPFSMLVKSTAALTSPDGSTTDERPSGGSLMVRDITRVGRYALAAGGASKAIFSSLRSDVESDIAPRTDLNLGGGAVKAQAAPVRFADFWRPLVLLALAVLAGEWWLFARRS